MSDLRGRCFSRVLHGFALARLGFGRISSALAQMTRRTSHAPLSCRTSGTEPRELKSLQDMKVSLENKARRYLRSLLKGLRHRRLGGEVSSSMSRAVLALYSIRCRRVGWAVAWVCGIEGPQGLVLTKDQPKWVDFSNFWSGLLITCCEREAKRRRSSTRQSKSKIRSCGIGPASNLGHQPACSPNS